MIYSLKKRINVMKKLLLTLLIPAFSLKINGAEIQQPQQAQQTQQTQQPKLTDHFGITLEVFQKCKLEASCCED
jgi:predicted lipoprotein with Yx(FWY)xxD motif